MKWELKNPSSGDMVRVKLGGIYHYGVFVSEDEIIQFGLAPSARAMLKDSEIEVCVSNVDDFLIGGFLETATLDKKENKKRRKPKETVAFARARLGEKGYNILYNNCEHFAYECVMGEKRCEQADTVRNLFKNMPISDVYLAKIPSETGEDTLYPQARQDEVDACTNDKVKRQKYYAWKLLEYALNRTFGYKMSNLVFEKTKRGKWTTPSCFFSISHSENAVAVAVSRREIGVDVEKIDGVKEGVIQKVLTKSENKEFSAIGVDENARRREYLVGKWTQKESVFKTADSGAFRPSKIETSAHALATKKVCVDGEEYMLSVATENLANARYYLEVDLSK